VRKLVVEAIGDRGENMFELAITEYQNFKTPLFKPSYLGEKWPAIDYYVELMGVRGTRPVFFVQVKSTSSVPTSKGLPVSISKRKCDALFQVPGPTYIVGVHEPSRKAFILSVHNRPAKGIYNIPAKCELTAQNLLALYAEVRDFWRQTQHKPLKSTFVP
jgi:hypothetical protein